MPAPEDTPVLDLGIAREAAANWKLTKAEREAKTARTEAQGVGAAEDPYRLTANVNRLLRAVRAQAPADPGALPETLRDLIRKGGATPADLENRAFEAIIGATRDFLSVEFLAMGLRSAEAVGRIVVRPRPGGAGSLGTGFLVAPGVVMTNHHVLRDAATAATATLEMGYETREGRTLAAESFALRPQAFFLTVPELDMTLVAVAEASRGGRPLAPYGFLPLIAEEGKIAIGEPVNIVQHPAGRAKEVVVRENRLLDLPKAINWAAHYEADTEPGSSGSPVFNDRWEVIALHHSGVPATDPQGHWLDIDGNRWEENDDPRRIQWIGNEGIRVSRLVGAIAASPVSEQGKALRDLVLGAEGLRRDAPAAAPSRAPGRPRQRAEAAPAAPAMATPPAAPAPTPPAGGVTLSVPLLVTVSLGAAAPAATAMPMAAPALLEAIEIDPDYDNRAGFDPEFCGFATPLPEPGPRIAGDVAAQEDGDHELRYHHYSVIQNAARRLAFVSAVNIDGDAPEVFEREGSDRWVFDPRIPEDAQAGNEFYARNPLDRGHLTRRKDAAWGNSPREAKLGNDDTFHWTNCAPQHEVFNQSDRATRRGLRLWGNLENHVLDAARADGLKLSVFNGPVFRDDDRAHRGLLVPREFFKVIAFRQGGRDRVLAFLLSQQELIRSLAEEALTAGPFRPFQLRLAEIERRTGLVFAASMHAADTLARRRRGAEESAAPPVALESLAEVVLAAEEPPEPPPAMPDPAPEPAPAPAPRGRRRGG